MLISQLINTLSSIMNTYGNINVEIYCDSRESNCTLPVFTDNIKVIKMKPENKGVYLSNEFIEFYEYKGCSCTVRYNSETGEYYGKLEPKIKVEGFNTTFSTKDKFQIINTFHYAVDEYLDFLSNAQVKQTMNKIKGITEEDEDIDYGEI